MWPQITFGLGVVVAMAIPILGMAYLFHDEQEQRKKVGRCHFVDE
jgi:hypothetical protein